MDTLTKPEHPQPSVPEPANRDAILAIDIEHIPVADDPRKWSPFRKNMVLVLIASGSLIAGLATNVQNPAIQSMEADLHTNASLISLSVSLFVAIQGSAPLVWAALSEIKGRKTVYIVSLFVFVVASIIVALSKTIGLVIGFRCFQAAGSSSVMTLGAATLADVFDPHERGTKMGIYYMAPLLGPAVGPIFGGLLTNAFNWRGPFWFLAITAGSSLMAFLLFFKDTFRKERSTMYQNALNRQLADRSARAKARAEKAAKSRVGTPMESREETKTEADLEKQVSSVNAVVMQELPDVKISFRELIPFGPLRTILRRFNNVTILFASGFLFAFNFAIGFAASRTLGGPGYDYDALHIGLVLLTFGVGSMVGSVLSGKWCDRVLARITEANGGVREPEMRLKSIGYPLWFFPLVIVGFGWMCREKVHIAGICVMLFVLGFLTAWIYTPTLACIVDSNVGRSSTAVSLNSAFRGVSACIQTEIVVPLQDHLGDGWMYTLFAGLMLISSVLIMITSIKGRQWRLEALRREEEAARRKASMRYEKSNYELPSPPHTEGGLSEDSSNTAC